MFSPWVIITLLITAKNLSILQGLPALKKRKQFHFLQALWQRHKQDSKQQITMLKYRKTSYYQYGDSYCGGSVMCISWDTLNQCNNNGAKNWGKIFQRTSVKNQYINF